MIYLDHNATTPLNPVALEAMLPWLRGAVGNPASTHGAGRRVRRTLEDARDQIAALLGAKGDEVIFTSGATEANNLALFGLAGDAPGQIVTSPLEHPCVVGPCEHLAKRGFRWTTLPVDRTGLVSFPDDATAADLRLVSIQLANHETGTIQPLEAIAEKLAARAPLHSDAAAAVGKMAVHFQKLGLSAMTVSAHKFGGPPGIGALVVNRCTKLQPQIFGGHQQHAKRPGTEAMALIAGFAAALEDATKKLEAHRQAGAKRRVLFLDALTRTAGPIVVNGPTDGIATTINISFPGCQADALVMALDLAGVACSTGSACSSGSLLPSPVIRALGVGPEILGSALRFSLSPDQSEAEISEAAERIAKVVNRLRAIET